MRFLVYGAGAVGGVVAARLHLTDEQVVAVARGDHHRTIAREGLTLLTPEGPQTVPVPVVGAMADAEPGDGDVVLLCVKSQDTDQALAALASAAHTRLPVVCVQNGVANERTALRWFSNVHGAVVMLPATFLQPGVVAAHSTPTYGILDVGRWPEGTNELTELITPTLRAAGFASEQIADVARWKHGKLLANLSNVVDALCGPDARSGPLARLARQEGQRCLDAAGIAYAPPEEDSARRGDLLAVRDTPGQPRQGSSSWQSLARATGTMETDYLNGEIVLIGRLHGIATPVNELLQQVARQHAHSRRPPASLDPDELLARLPNQVDLFSSPPAAPRSVPEEKVGGLGASARPVQGVRSGEGDASG